MTGLAEHSKFPVPLMGVNVIESENLGYKKKYVVLESFAKLS